MSDVKILDLRPRLKARQQGQCAHPCVVVDYTAAEMECEDCGKPIDPWWFLRKMAREEMNLREETEAECAKKRAECNEMIARANETVARLNADIRQLTDTRNRLMNEQVGGVRVGSARRSPRRRT